MKKTVDDMYLHAIENNKLLLSDYPSAFWADYVTNHVRYDRLFRRSFSSFRYYYQYTNESVEDVTDDFIDAVYSHLLMNDKRYSELFRLNNLSDTDYQFDKPINITETYSGSSSDSGSENFGSFTNTDSKVVGARTDSSSESLGTHTDTSSETLGAHTDGTTETLGQRSDSKSETIGSKTDATTETTGAQTNISTEKVSPYDTDDFYNANEGINELGARSDSSSTTYGSQTNSESSTLGSQSNTKSNEYGAQNNSKSDVYGAQQNSSSSSIGEQTTTDTYIEGAKQNSHTNTGTDSYTKTRSGSDGRYLPTDSLEGHKEFWSMYEFYAFIFSDICKELLLV